MSNKTNKSSDAELHSQSNVSTRRRSTKDIAESYLAAIFGIIFLGLSFIVTIETILRKIFNISLQGADELGGYSLAIGTTIAITLALFGRSHIRVDVLHWKFGEKTQATLNWFSILSLAIFASFVAWVSAIVLIDSAEYQSSAATPWGTPLIYPQSLWFLGLLAFAMIAAAMAIKASWLFASGRNISLNEDFGPRSVKNEINEELESIKIRKASEKESQK